VDGIRADVLVAAGDTTAAAEALRSAVSVLDGCERPWLLPLPLVQLASLLKGSGAAEEAKDLIHRALALAAQWPDDDFDEGDALRTLADACRQTKDYAAAARHLADAAARLDRKGDVKRAAYARFFLSQALNEDGRTADAVAVLESMLGDKAEAQLSVEAVAQARLDLGRGLTRLGEHAAAAEEFVRLADQTSDWEERGVHTMVVCELAGALARAALWDQARAAVARALTAHATAPDPAAVCRMLRICADRRQAQPKDQETLDEVLEYLRRSDEVNDAAPEGPNYRRWPETAYNAQSRAQALAEAGRNKEALEAIEHSIAAWQTGGEVALEPLAEATRIAAILEGHCLGLTQEARARLAPVITRCEARGLTEPTATLRRLSDSLAPTSGSDGKD
jgi:tetratricopeptide (TPR) repeat protein